MVYVVMVYSYGPYSYGLYSYGLCSHGLCSYGPYSCGLYSYGLIWLWHLQLPTLARSMPACVLKAYTGMAEQVFLILSVYSYGNQDW